MLDVALRSLVHDRGKLVASIAGVAFASALLLVQMGLYAGLVSAASALIYRTGGDLWVMHRGTEVLDNGETLSAASRTVAAEQPCVAHVRGVVFAVAPVRKRSGALDYVQVVGVEASVSHPPVPWSLERGLLRDLDAPMRIAIDEHDVGKLQIGKSPIGADVDIGGKIAHVAGLTRGIRSFSLYPLVFTHIDNARRLSNTKDGHAQYWVLDLERPSCVPGVIASLSQQRELEARSTAGFADLTERYWIFGSGAGAAIAFSALFSLVIGTVIVGQTLYSLTREHLRELATLKAMGATRRELVGFVSWQASFLAVVGGLLGLVMAVSLRDVLSSQGIEIVLSPAVLAVSAAAVVSMCGLASVPSTRKVLAVEAAEVFR
jgi:putative ABC transport system permease protein